MIVQLRRGQKIRSFLRENPLPALALLGLLIGGVARLGFQQTALADWIWLAVLIGCGAPVVWKTVRGMVRGEFAADVVAMLAIVTAVIMGEYFAGVIIVIMQTGGEALEVYSLRRASSSLTSLLARAPSKAFRKTQGSMVEISVDTVQIGDVLMVRANDLIPVDGVLLADQAEVDEAALTGEPLARPKKNGDLLLSGSVNVGDAFDMRATKLSTDSQYARIVELVRKAQAEKPPLQRLADKYAVWLTPVTLLMCALGWWITGDAQTILAVLVVATPCPLILAVPVAVISGINRAAKAGIIVKGGTAIEQIGQATAVVFDKTGTLTLGMPVFKNVVLFDSPVIDQPPINQPNGASNTASNGAANLDQHDLLRLAGSVEQLSTHLLGRTLATAAQQQFGPLNMPDNFREIPGKGIEADLDGHRVLIGSPAFLVEQTKQPIPAKHAPTDDAIVTYIAVDGLPKGMVFFDDQMRPGVRALLKRLHSLGVKRTVMLTGDNRKHATVIGEQAGVDEVVANLLPEDKVHAVEQLKLTYPIVVMVGDGINDAPALATATVGVAMGAHGTGISAEAADIVLLVDDVSKVAEAMAIGQHMVKIAKQSIFVGLGLSLSFMVLAAFGFIAPVMGALLQEVIDAAVILNALRAALPPNDG
ncbi:MAG: heavy metal translocating P-type ATPase [Caldilineaceae bacterium]